MASEFTDYEKRLYNSIVASVFLSRESEFTVRSEHAGMSILCQVYEDYDETDDELPPFKTFAGVWVARGVIANRINVDFAAAQALIVSGLLYRHHESVFHSNHTRHEFVYYYPREMFSFI